MSVKTKTVYHPHLPGVSYDVPEGDASGWKEQGWRFTDPAIPTPAATEGATTSK